MHDTTTDRPWSPGKRLLFRFGALYLLLYSFPFPLGYVPGTDTAGEFLSDLWDPLVLWTGKQVLGLAEIPIQPTGSGDTTYAYLQLLLMPLLALLGTALWTLLERGRRPWIPYPRPAGRLSILCRYYVGFIVFSYGAFKVIKTQFPFPDLVRLTTPYGESSPMGLLWTFMGYSTPYNLFAGGLEMLGGLLLLFRRTTTLGALVTVGVMSNVAMLNFSYDVPVKLFSTHLLLFAAVLAARDSRRLLNLLLLNRAAPAADLSAPWPTSWNHGRRRWILHGLKTLLVGSVLVSLLIQVFGVYRRVGPDRPRSPLYGLYEVETFVLDGEQRPPLVTDEERWRLVIFDWPGRPAFRRMDGSLERLTAEVDEGAGILSWAPRGQEEKETWTLERPAPDRLRLEGDWQGHQLSMELVAQDPDRFLLVNRGYNWVQEVPFNR